jgi:hypothetical protein
LSTNLKNPNDQDEHKNEMLMDQPQLLPVTPTVLLASRECQPIKCVTSFGTDFEMNFNIQGYYKEHLTSAGAITCLFGDGVPDAAHLKVNAAVAKKFAQTEKPHGNHELS